MVCKVMKKYVNQKKIKKYNISETISSLTMFESFSATYHKSVTAPH